MYRNMSCYNNNIASLYPSQFLFGQIYHQNWFGACVWWGKSQWIGVTSVTESRVSAPAADRDLILNHVIELNSYPGQLGKSLPFSLFDFGFNFELKR